MTCTQLESGGLETAPDGVTRLTITETSEYNPTGWWQRACVLFIVIALMVCCWGAWFPIACMGVGVAVALFAILEFATWPRRTSHEVPVAGVTDEAAEHLDRLGQVTTEDAPTSFETLWRLTRLKDRYGEDPEELERVAGHLVCQLADGLDRAGRI